MPTDENVITVREDVRSAAWNYLALLDQHRKVFHQDNCPERGNFPLWYEHKAESWERVEAALDRLRDALASSVVTCTCPLEWTGITAPLRGHAPGCPVQ